MVAKRELVCNFRIFNILHFLVILSIENLRQKMKRSLNSFLSEVWKNTRENSDLWPLKPVILRQLVKAMEPQRKRRRSYILYCTSDSSGLLCCFSSSRSVYLSICAAYRVNTSSKFHLVNYTMHLDKLCGKFPGIQWFHRHHLKAF